MQNQKSKIKYKKHKLKNIKSFLIFRFFHFSVFRYVFFIFGLLFFILSWQAFALNNPEHEATKVIKEYVISKYPSWAGLDIHITFKYADKVFNDLKSADAIKVMETYKDLRPAGNVIIPLEVASGALSTRAFVRAKIEVFKKIAVAENLIKRGETIEAADLKLEERDIALLPQKYFEKMEEVFGKEAKTTIPANSTIFSWMIKEIPVVRRGDEIALLVTAPHLAVKTKGIALGDGYLGEKIQVKRKGTKKTVEGILISASEVEVKLK